MNERILTKLDCFLFFFRMNNLARRSGCGCSLKTGVEIISIIQLIYYFLDFTGINLLIGTTFRLFQYIYYFCIILVTIGSFNLLLSCNSKSLNLGYYGYIFYSIEFYLSIMLYFVWIVNKFYEIYFISSMGLSVSLMYLIIILLYFGIIITCKLYFLWIVFSYNKFFAKGDINIVNNISLHDYIRIDSHQNVDPNRL